MGTTGGIGLVYFPLTAPAVVEVWLAVTEATLVNGAFTCSRVRVEPVTRSMPDRRPSADHGYFEIVDHDMLSAEPY